MNYISFNKIFKNYKNTVFYLLLGIFMIIMLSQFGYIRNVISEGFSLQDVNNTINTIKSETEQLKKDKIELDNLTKIINDETNRINLNITKLNEDTKILNAETLNINKEIDNLNTQFRDSNQGQTGGPQSGQPRAAVPVPR